MLGGGLLVRAPKGNEELCCTCRQLCRGVHPCVLWPKHATHARTFMNIVHMVVVQPGPLL